MHTKKGLKAYAGNKCPRVIIARASAKKKNKNNEVREALSGGCWGNMSDLFYFLGKRFKILHIQLMHSFEVNIRICQSKNSDAHLGEHHFRGSTNPDVNRKRMYQLFCYMTLHVFLVLVLYNVSSYL